MFTPKNRTLRAVILACAIPFASAACVATAEVPPPEVADGYEPQYYDGYVVYYDDGGRPYYYVNGAVTWVPAGSAYYNPLVTHWHAHGAAYGRWYAHRGYRYKGYRRR